VTFVTEESVETSPDGSVEMDVEYRSTRLLITLEGRTVSFSLDRDRQLARLSDDTHQVEPTPDDIPDAVLRHILAAGWRLQARGERDEDGEHVLWVRATDYSFDNAE